MAAGDRSELVEAAVSAFRERNPSGRILAAPAWWDLSPEDRDLVFERQLQSRLLERALDERGLSGTARAVLGRIGRES